VDAYLEPKGSAISGLVPLTNERTTIGRAADAEIAERLYIGPATVKFHLDNLFDKFGLTQPGEGRRVALANDALRRGSINLAELRHG
jgi:DNA-binding NarL/FixJ family response regulator